jgi:ketosteroid isomerase-like protein
MRTLGITLFFLLSTAAAVGADEVRDINALLDAWHRAAATADETVFFDSMADDAVYLGTDPSERWTKEQFMAWSKKHFDKESAWAFEPRDRTVYLSTDGRFAWFEELLDTWMGVCRGSGVLVREAGDDKETGGWKIKHYNLAVTVPNDLIEAYISIFPKPEEEADSN